MHGDSDEAEHVSAWRTHLDDQLARTLRQSPSLRDSQLHLVITQAPKEGDLRLTNTAWALIHIIESSTKPTHRIMAVQALHTLNEDQVGERSYRQMMNKLHGLMKDESSERVRGLARVMLTDYTKRS